METLHGVRHLTQKWDYMFSFDLQDGFYAMGINPTDRYYFTVNVRGQLYTLAGLPMGWSLPPSIFSEDADVGKLPARRGSHITYRAAK
jgi:hypothetical protein